MHKIMFNDKYGLTQAVLDGQKTMTRRILNIQPPSDDCCIGWLMDSENSKDKKYENRAAWLRDNEQVSDFIKHYTVGEFIAITQSYKSINEFYTIAYNRYNSYHGQTITQYDIPFKEIVKWFNMRENLKNTSGWTNKMFVKADLMLHHIRITETKIERLQDISNEDCLQEGVNEDAKGIQYSFNTNIGYCNQYPFATPRDAFAALIDKVSGKDTWNSNPYVIAYSFELID